MKYAALANSLNTVILTLLPSLVFAATPAASEGLPVEPAAACDMMAAAGLRTRGGYRETGSTHQCRSQRQNIAGSGRVSNTIRFVARGDADKVTQLSLELQVNSRTGMQRAHRSLVEHADTLLGKALNTEMPSEIEAAILSALRGTWTLDGRVVVLQRISFNGPAYELHFRIQ